MTINLYARPKHDKNTTNSTKSKANTQGLFTGVSAAALMLGATGSALGQGITITKPTSSVVLSTKANPDFLDIEAPVAGDVVNNGNIGTSEGGIIVDGGNGGSVGGDIINNGTINATKGGIVVFGTKKNDDPLGGSIINKGDINVARGTKTKLFSSAFGILVSGPSVATSVSNTGNLNVLLIASGTSHTAAGIGIDSNGPLASNITNSGEISALGFAVGSTGLGDTDASIRAFGAVANNFGGSAATTNSLVNSSGGSIRAAGLAIATGPSATANAFAIGGGAAAFGSSGTANVASVSNATSATIEGLAFGGVVGSSVNVGVTGIGVNQAAFGGSAISQSVTNAGDINGVAKGSASVLTSGDGNIALNAFGVLQTAGGSPSITQNVNNSGEINARASASANQASGASDANVNASTVTAVGVFQSASGNTGTVSNSLSVTNSSQGSINVTAEAFAAGDESPDAMADAVGVSQNSSGAGAHSLTFSNDGALNVNALATAIGITSPTATASAVGVRQQVSASSGATNIDLTIANNAFSNGTTTFTGSIAVSASAFAFGATTDTADASVDVQGSAVLVQSVNGATAGADVNLLITNQGNMSFNFFASATGVDADVDSGRISGRWQNVAGTASSAAATFINSSGANFTVSVGGSASGTDADVNVIAIGGWQTINAQQNASALVQNDGTINVRAFANAVGSDVLADASAQSGLFQSANATGGAGSTASATINNTSLLSINLNATANASGVSEADATAFIADGFEQYAYAESANVAFDNSGAINLFVSANAVATSSNGDADANATIETAFFQSATANFGSQLSADVSFNNSGNINLTAVANATAPDVASALASLSKAFEQIASDADSASVNFTNTVTGNVDINLTAAASGGDALASATVHSAVFDLSANAGDDNLSASATFVNDGDISLNVLVDGFGTDGTSGFGTTVDASFDGDQFLELFAFNGADSLVSFENNGNIMIDIDAIGVNGNSADADIEFETIFNLSASANGGTSDTVTGIFNNNGLIDVDFFASATGGTTVDADVDLDYFLVESVQDASVSSFSVTNSATGVISLDLVANAIATGDASADVSLTSFFEISAYASSGDQESATVNILNDGVIDVNLSGFASGTDAEVDISIEYGFFHIASDGDVSTVTFTNNNSITFDLNGTAVGTDVDAEVSFSYPFYLSANAGGDRNSATATLTNSATGNIEINLLAQALGSNGTGGLGTAADASATVETVITELNALDAETAFSLFQNDGSFTVQVGALASNATDASASAEIGYFLEQSASGTGGAGSSATATFNNTSSMSLNLLITAQAFGSTDADASAEFDDTIIEQDANNAQFAEVNITNSGAFNVLAQATAVASNGAAEAEAEIDYGNSQSATANGSAGSTATVNFTNTETGTITFQAIAIATGFGTATTNDTVDASATIDEWLYQDADTADTLAVNFTNDGTIILLAQASALGQDAEASASVASEIVDQDANNAGSGQVSSTATFTNNGLIDIDVLAKAVGTNGTGGPGLTVDADASFDTLLEQDADDSDTNSASFLNSATGTIDISVIAMASNGTDVSATAEMDDTFIDQEADGDDSPNSLSSSVSIVNDGTINILYMAQATGSNTADAYVSFGDTIFDQDADGAGDVSATFMNTGNISVQGIAFASALTGDASATIDMQDEFITQEANADDGNEMTALASIYNSGNISLLLSAQAVGATDATASVDFSEDVFYQSATADNTSGGATATVDFHNSATGTIDFQLKARATGTDAYASASYTSYLIYQTADAADGDVVSTTFTNDGTINFLAQATAIGIPTGTTSLASPAPTASAYAFIDETIIYQEVQNGQDADNTIINNGTINFTAIAIASNASDAEATASIGAYGFYQTVDVQTTGTGGTADATVVNTSNLSINFNAFAQAIGITSASASAEFDSQIIYQTVEGETATASIDNSGAINVNLTAIATAAGDGTDGYAFASGSIDYGISQNANANSDDGDQLFAGTYFNNSGTLILSNIAMADGTTEASAYAYNDHILYQYPDSADVVVAEVQNDGTMSLSGHAWARGSDAYAFASTKTLISQSVDAGDDRVSATATIVNNGTLSGSARATALGTNGTGGPGSSATATASMESGIHQYAYNAGTAAATINNNGDFTMSALAFASNASDAEANAYVYRGISQTAQAINTTGSSATAEITNTSLTSFDITANAKAVGVTDADAMATLSKTIIYQSVEHADVVSETIDNSGAMNISVVAMATAVGDGTSGNASATAGIDYGFYQYASADYAQISASNTFNNSGIIDVDVAAMAVGTTKVYASAFTQNQFIYQSAQNGATVTNVFDNSGSLSHYNMAVASGGSNVDAYAYGNTGGNEVIAQFANAGGDQDVASNSFINQSGADISFIYDASAVGSSAATSVYASAAIFRDFFTQNANSALDSSNLLQNDGTFTVVLNAFASNPNSQSFAGAWAWIQTDFINQVASGLGGTTTSAGHFSSNTLTNSSSLSLNLIMNAEAHGGTVATANAWLGQTLIFQGAYNNETSTNLINNNGAINVGLDAAAIATGNGTTGFAFARAIINEGIIQSATANDGTAAVASNVFNNVVGPPSIQNGSIVYDLNAHASGTTNATALATVDTAVWQWAEGDGTLSNLFNNNTGSVSFMANATAQGGTDALALAFMDYVWQSVSATTTGVVQSNTFSNRNSASFVVNVEAFADITGTGSSAFASAQAYGVNQNNNNTANTATFGANFVNTNEDAFTGQPISLFQVMAFASASGGTMANVANAYATGYRVQNNTNSNPVLDVTNNGTFRVYASAFGSTVQATAYGMNFNGGEIEGTVNNGGTIDVRAFSPGGSASAIGVQFNSAINNSTFTNTGTINVLATGSTTGIAVIYGGHGGHTIMATKADHATFINDGGTVWAGENNGTLGFGTAFDLSGAPNSVTLDFRGTNQPGTVWGNIWLSDDDNIWVNNGMTYYAGMVNSSLAFDGFLTIGSGGTLTLASTGTGPAMGYFDTFTNTASGTLAFNVTPSTPTTGLGQINAITANLAGTVKLNITPGLYANNQTYQDVVVASTINGSFTNTSINTNTPLLSLSALQPGDGTVDLALTRNSFASPAGLTINQMSAGLGLDGGYSTALTGPFGSLVSSLFTLSSAAYVNALEQLHGSEHVQNLRSNLWSTNLLNYALDERINAGTFSNDRTNNSDSIIRKGDLTTWGSFQHTTGNLEGDIEASGYDQRQNAFYGGFDYAVTNDILVGFASGFYRTRLDFTNGTRKQDEGVQLAVYAAYDSQDFYLRGNFSLGFLNAESDRNINIASQIGLARGDYDTDIYGFHFEGGKRFAVGDNFYFTPFIGLDYVKAESDAFVETGITGANLANPQNELTSFRGEIGARFAGGFEAGSNSTIVPEIYFKYRNEFKDEVMSIGSSFAGAAGSNFNVISSHVDSGEFVVGGGVSFSKGDKVEVKLMYTGRFNSQIEEHGLGIRLSVLLGDRN